MTDFLQLASSCNNDIYDPTFSAAREYVWFSLHFDNRRMVPMRRLGFFVKNNAYVSSYKKATYSLETAIAGSF